jgi:hypothetical protein
VLKWCHTSRQRHAGPLDSDPTLNGFDLFILHLDVDVAGKSYADCGPEIEAAATAWQWEHLPCAESCPPVAATCARLEAVLNSWLGQAAPGRRTVYCLPAQSSGTWLAVAALPATHALLAGGECNTGLESGLAQITKGQRIKKTVREYRQQAPRITAQWSVVRQVCSQAQTFEEAVLAAVAP